MPDKNTTELDEILEDLIYPKIVERGIGGMEKAKSKAREALLLWRDTEVIKELEAIPIRDETNEWDAVEIVDEVQQYIFTRKELLQSNLKEKD